MSLVPTDFHLALEAVVAYVDGELSPGAQARAMAHVTVCPQCSFDVAAQREAKTLLVGTGGPELPGSLLSRLQQIPFTTDLQMPGTWVMQGANVQWSREIGPDPSASAPPLTQPAPPDRRPLGRAQAVTGPGSRRKGLSATRLRRMRRGLMGAVAGLTVGVLAASVAPVAVSAGSATSQIRQLPTEDGAGVSAALFSIEEAMTTRRFSGAATGLR